MAKILLVEDDNNLREIYEARLTAEGYDIATAQDGEEALVSAKKEHPDLIISDVMMPRISGFEMLDILRNTDELKNTKIIMLTALGQAEDQARADTLGADKYLVKSQVTLEDIVNSAKALLGETVATGADAPYQGAASATPDPTPAPTPTPPSPDPTIPAPPPTVVDAAQAAPQTTPAAVVNPTENAADEAPATPTATDAPAEAPVTPPLDALPSAQSSAVAPVELPVTTPAQSDDAAVPAVSDPAQTIVSTDSSPSAPTPEPVEPDEAAEAPVPAPVIPAPPLSLPPLDASIQTTEPVLADSPVPTPAVAATPTAHPETDAAPEPAPSQVVESASTAGAEQSVSQSEPQTLAAEEAALQQQIDGYLKQPAASNVPQDRPVEITPSPASSPPPDASNGLTPDNDAIDSALIADAVHKLDGNSPDDTAPKPTLIVPQAQTVPLEEETAAAPEPDVQPVTTSRGDNVSIAHKKVLQPISEPSTKPSLDELLAKEEAAQGTPPAAPMVNGQPAAAPTDTPAPKPGASFDPNAISL